ncbi:hypothetical protein [Microbacterium sp. CPCC 204701]|uniref:hypothetical protein n=1 Tax=Microbacterium sp. CPCC 204701 TaxID=2493084 RepID=UPI000FD79C83|nr:hypothetical protein [Microbacterium sp. CPCC 204701]
MAKKTGDGYRKGQVTDRYKVYNERTDRWDKYDGGANYVDSNVTEGPWNSIEKKEARKPPR